MSVESVQVYNDLTRYEEALGGLVDSVDQFRPQLAAARQLVEADRALGRSLAQFAQYDRVDRELQRLDRRAERLDARTARTLETLDECYRALSALPMVEQVRFEQRTVLDQRRRVNSAVLLQYATRLSKFTRAPPGVAAGPNNFVWPAEDALRRGQLAVAAQLGGNAGVSSAGEGDSAEGGSAGGAIGGAGEVSADAEPGAPKRSPEVPEPGVPVPGHPGAPAAHRPERVDASESPVDLDLDLFDPEDF